MNAIGMVSSPCGVYVRVRSAAGSILIYSVRGVDMGNITVIYVFLGFLLGACLGSFVNAAALRTVAEEKVVGQ